MENKKSAKSKTAWLLYIAAIALALAGVQAFVTRDSAECSDLSRLPKDHICRKLNEINNKIDRLAKNHGYVRVPKHEKRHPRDLEPVAGQIRSWADVWVYGSKHPGYRDCFTSTTDIPWKEVRRFVRLQTDGWNMVIELPKGTKITNTFGLGDGACDVVHGYRLPTKRYALTTPGPDKKTPGRPVVLTVCGNPITKPGGKIDDGPQDDCEGDYCNKPPKPTPTEPPEDECGLNPDDVCEEPSPTPTPTDEGKHDDGPSNECDGNKCADPPADGEGNPDDEEVPDQDGTPRDEDDGCSGLEPDECPTSDPDSSGHPDEISSPPKEDDDLGVPPGDNLEPDEGSDPPDEGPVTTPESGVDHDTPGDPGEPA